MKTALHGGYGDKAKDDTMARWILITFHFTFGKANEYNLFELLPIYRDQYFARSHVWQQMQEKSVALA